MADPSCIPVKVALQLMDPSSLGLASEYDRFQEVHAQLQNALKVIVNEHHQAFNSSIGTFHKIQQAIQTSQQRVRVLRAGLVQAKSSFAADRPELKAFSTTSQTYDSMLQVIASIEQLQLVPERLEAQISEKRFLGAVETLQDALEHIRRPEMEDVGALSELRLYLSNQEHSLTDILVEELHSHLYLKSPYCEERWKSHMKRESTNTGIDVDEQAIQEFLDVYDGSRPMQEDTTRNPEADTFYYIELLMESLHKMERLDVAIDAIEQRLPVELFRVVEKTIFEVEQRHPSTLMSAARQAQSSSSVGQSPNNEQKSTLEDLLATLYAKFEAIAEGHRVLHDVTKAITTRSNMTDVSSLSRSFRELWKLLQSEVRTLLHDHLATSGNLSARSRQENIASANIFRTQPRDRTRKLFKLADTIDSNSAEFATEREDLEFILKASVPGLVDSSAKDSKKERDDDTHPDRSATGHKLLVEPSVFNMGILLPPSLMFLNNLKGVIPPNSGIAPATLTSFLDDFLINVFYPQLDETLLDLCSRSMSDLDAFQADPKWQQHAQMPIFKGTARFYELIEAFCLLLDQLPHDQSFSQLVVTQMRNYYDRCYQWSQALLQRVQMSQETAAPKMRLAADLATGGELKDVVSELLKDQSETVDSVVQKEVALLLRLVKSRHLTEADLINDRKSLAALCTLHVSMKWLASRCQQLRYISPRAIDTANTQSHQSRRWTAAIGLANVHPGPFLPMDSNTAETFDAVITSFTELSTLILRTLHIDIRLQILYGIYTSMDTTYALGQPYNDPDPAILALNTSLSVYDGHISTHILGKQYLFLTSHLHVLVNNALTSLVGCIPAMDIFGNARIQLNVLVLQQSLKIFQPDADLGKAARFYELAEQGPEAVVTNGSSEGFAREDLKALVRLCWVIERDAMVGTVDEFVARL